MDHGLGAGEAGERDIGMVLAQIDHRLLAQPPGGLQRRGLHRHRAKYLILVQEQGAKLRLAHPHRVRQDRLEHRLELAPRARDDAQHV